MGQFTLPSVKFKNTKFLVRMCSNVWEFPFSPNHIFTFKCFQFCECKKNDNEALVHISLLRMLLSIFSYLLSICAFSFVTCLYSCFTFCPFSVVLSVFSLLILHILDIFFILVLCQLYVISQSLQISSLSLCFPFYSFYCFFWWIEVLHFKAVTLKYFHHDYCTLCILRKPSLPYSNEGILRRYLLKVL